VGGLTACTYPVPHPHHTQKNKIMKTSEPTKKEPAFGYFWTASILSLTGVMILVAVYMPLIDPSSVHYEVTLSRYLYGTPASLFILAAAWYFWRKAIHLKRAERDAKLFDKPAA